MIYIYIYIYSVICYDIRYCNEYTVRLQGEAWGAGLALALVASAAGCALRASGRLTAQRQSIIYYNEI